MGFCRDDNSKYQWNIYITYPAKQKSGKNNTKFQGVDDFSQSWSFLVT